MLQFSTAPFVDISGIITNNVTTAALLFRGSKSERIDLSNLVFTKNVNFNSAFLQTIATEIIMWQTPFTIGTTFQMYADSKAMVIDLSNASLPSSPFVDNFARNSPATIGYTRTQRDADILNASSGKPATLTFVVKE